jgi:hypothetical protein
MSALFEAQATKERVLPLRECVEYVFAHRGLYNIFQKGKLANLKLVDGACPSVNRINSDLFSFFRKFQHPN